MNLRSLARALPHPHAERSIPPAPGLSVPHHRVGPTGEWRVFLRRRRAQWGPELAAILFAEAWLVFWLVLFARLG